MGKKAVLKQKQFDKLHNISRMLQDHYDVMEGIGTEVMIGSSPLYILTNKEYQGMLNFISKTQGKLDDFIEGECTDGDDPTNS